MAETYHLSQMLGMRGAGLVVAAAGLCAVAILFGCDGSRTDRRTTPATPSSEAAPGSQRLSRPEVACRLHSCAPPRYCNQRTGLCELLPCGRDADCPYGYKCNHSRHVCE